MVIAVARQSTAQGYNWFNPMMCMLLSILCFSNPNCIMSSRSVMNTFLHSKTFINFHSFSGLVVIAVARQAAAKAINGGSNSKVSFAFLKINKYF